VLVPLLATLAQGLDALVAVPAAIPVWDQYVNGLEWVLDGLANLLRSGALAIIAFTIIVKTIVLPLTVQSIRSSKAMQELQPKIKELQKKHGKDRQALSQATMALYQANHVNPMAGCLPMVIQIPIFFGVYQAIMHLSTNGEGTSQYWGDTFLWLGNGLGRPDPIFILPLAAAAFQFVQTQMMRPANQGPIEDPQQRMMNSMMNFMPLMVIFFGWNFASGAVLYWVTQSVYSVVQQWFITGWGRMRDWFPRLPELPDHRRLGYRPPRPVSDAVVMSGQAPIRQKGAMGWIQQRMEEAQRQAEARRGTTGGAAEAATQSAEAPAATATTTATAGPARPPGAARRAGGRSTRSRNGNGNGRAKAIPATDGGNGAAGQAAAQSSSGAVVIPRKARPATGGDGRGRSRQ